MDPRATVQAYLDQGLSLVFWPPVEDWKGPREKDWLTRVYTIDDYHDGDRVGIMHGVEMTTGKYVVDVDIDWAPGLSIAQALLPSTKFIWGRASKKISHCLYLTPDVIPSFAYKDIGKDGRTLIEFRPDKHQSMAPPSIWQKGDLREPLTFVSYGELTFVDSCGKLKQRVCLSAIGMLLALHFGHNGFGHEARLAWAGFLLRAGIPVDDLVVMGRAISECCNNQEIADVRRVVESTAAALAKEGRKVRGGPALAKILGEHGKAIVGRINEWIGRDSDFIRNNAGMILPRNQENVRRAIELLGHELSYNQFSDKPLIDGHELKDREIDHIELMIDSEFHFQPPEKFFQKVILNIAWTNGFHPVQQYLNALTWDRVPRIDTWLITCAKAEDTPYVRAISSIMLIAAVRRIQHPGCKYDEMVVWESPQGGLKSSAAQALCPHAEWFSDDLRLNLQSQQLIEGTLGKWIIEASDLAGKRKAEIDQLKAMMSRQVDGPARMAYAHYPVERPRHFILIGTTNSTAYLTDPTGARRFWPVKVQPFDVKWITTWRDQLWAEAGVREAAGESIRLHEDLWPAAAEHQEQRREVDPWEAVIRRMLYAQAVSSDGKRRVVTNAIWVALDIKTDRRDRYGALRISDIMQRLGFKRTRVRPEGEEVQVGYIQEHEGDLELNDEDVGRVPGSDDTPF